MNELIEKMVELDKFMIDKLSAIKNPNYVNAIQNARKILCDAITIVAIANK